MKIVLTLAASLLALPALAGDLRTMMQQPGEWEATISGNMMPLKNAKRLLCRRQGRSPI